LLLLPSMDFAAATPILSMDQFERPIFI
jgi:hypothetical protein